MLADGYGENILIDGLETFANTISTDGLEVPGLALVDIGEVIRPANVVPVEGSMIYPSAKVKSSLWKVV